MVIKFPGNHRNNDRAFRDLGIPSCCLSAVTSLVLLTTTTAAARALSYFCHQKRFRFAPRSLLCPCCVSVLLAATLQLQATRRRR
eukprot:g30301.t1